MVGEFQEYVACSGLLRFIVADGLSELGQWDQLWSLRDAHRLAFEFFYILRCPDRHIDSTGLLEDVEV